MRIFRVMAVRAMNAAVQRKTKLQDTKEHGFGTLECRLRTEQSTNDWVFG